MYRLPTKTANLIILMLVIVIGVLLFVLLSSRSIADVVSELSEDPRVDYLDNGQADQTAFLREEEVVIIDEDNKPQFLPVEGVLFEYVEVVDSCGPFYQGDCLVVRSGPGTEYPAISSLRNGMVLKVGGIVEREDRNWYKIVFDEWLRYPDRLNGDWYVASEYVEILLNEGDRTVWDHDYSTTSTKTITVDRSEQMIYAFDGDELFLESPISTGLELTPTPRGTFTVFKKTPSRYMQGPLPYLDNQDYYDLPGVPWNLYFTEQGAVIHGAYWHESFGTQYSHGCVNLEPSNAEKLYIWADLGTTVIVKD